MNRLPDEIVLQIFNKLIDLKLLCSCYLVSRRFSSIVLEVDAIAITALLINPLSPDVSPFRQLPPFIWLLESKCYTFLCKFKGVKSLFIELPSSSEIGIVNRCLFKWKVKFGKRIESIMYLFPNLIRDKDGFCVNGDRDGDGEEDIEVMIGMFDKYGGVAVHCLQDAMGWHAMLLKLIKNLPTLEKVSITDSGRRGRLSLSGEKLIELKGWLNSASATKMGRLQSPNIYCNAYIPVLNLPVSGYMMKGIYFGAMKINHVQGENDEIVNSNHGFEDKEEAAYTEAVMEILEKHRDTIHTSKYVPKQ